MDREFQIDQAAARELGIERALARLMRRHFAAHRQHIFAERLGIAALRQHLHHRLADLFARAIRPCQHPRPAQRHMLPRPGVFLLIAGKTVEADRQRPLRTLRPQPRIDFV